VRINVETTSLPIACCWFFFNLPSRAGWRDCCTCPYASNFLKSCNFCGYDIFKLPLCPWAFAADDDSKGAHCSTLLHHNNRMFTPKEILLFTTELQGAVRFTPQRGIQILYSIHQNFYIPVLPGHMQLIFLSLDMPLIWLFTLRKMTTQGVRDSQSNSRVMAWWEPLCKQDGFSPCLGKHWPQKQWRTVGLDEDGGHGRSISKDQLAVRVQRIAKCDTGHGSPSREGGGPRCERRRQGAN
jgi:hypothetical protein